MRWPHVIEAAKRFLIDMIFDEGHEVDNESC